jgi:5'-nucleotidase (lipoprotein e(P4) family)
MKYILLLLLCITLLSACKPKAKQPVSAEATPPNNEYLIQSVLWFERSGEMMALYYQGYNLAKKNLDLYLSKNIKSKRKKAVIVDIDETVLNNSPYETRLLRSDSVYTNETWNQWVTAAKADTLPGAYTFLKYASSKGVEVFYVSNRDSAYRQPTLQNLKRFNLPWADEKHLLLKGEKENGKESRRRKIAAEYDIILLCGDNLGDFYFVFDDRMQNQAIDSVLKYKAEFGKRFIVFPNPMYGDWEKPIYNSRNWTAQERDSLRKANLVE